MNTVNVYMVWKPSYFEEVRNLCKKYAHEAEEVLIEETIHLPLVWYEAVCQRPLDNYIFLSGKGGYDDTGHRKVVAIKCFNKPTPATIITYSLPAWSGLTWNRLYFS